MMRIALKEFEDERGDLDLNPMLADIIINEG